MSFPPLSHDAEPALDPATTVNHVLARWPGAARVLDAFGIDTCCGGGASLREAAADAGVPLDRLLADVAGAGRAP
jgi:regulator of cell morphogenesis and NO signaling